MLGLIIQQKLSLNSYGKSTRIQRLLPKVRLAFSHFFAKPQNQAVAFTFFVPVQLYFFLHNVHDMSQCFEKEKGLKIATEFSMSKSKRRSEYR